MLEDGFCCQYTSSHSNAFSGLLSDAAFAQESSPLCFHKVATPYAQPLLVMLDQTCFGTKFQLQLGWRAFECHVRESILRSENTLSLRVNYYITHLGL